MMNRKLIAAAIVALSGAFALNAQQNCNPGQNCPQQNCKEQQCAPGQNCAADKKCPFGPGNVFEGLNLTADQQTKLKALRQNDRAQKKDVKENKLALRQENRKKMLADIKAILTPEQYVQFLENSYMQGGRKFGKDFAQKHDRKHDKRMHRPDMKTKTADQNK